MTEEEYDLKNAKFIRGRKYILGVFVLIFLLTSYYVGLFIDISSFFYNLVISVFLGLNVGALFIGLRITNKTNLQWIFSFSLSLIIAFSSILSFYLTDDIARDQRSSARFLVLTNCVSLALSLGLGILISFNSEIERITKLIWFSRPSKEGVLKIESLEIN